MASENPSYLQVFLTFARNSLVRDLSFRSNFFIEFFASTSWVFMNIGFYLLIFHYTKEIGSGTGWEKYEFFAFLATTMFINSLVQAFFMPNAEEFSELIRTGNLDFALLKPIDTQFLISLHKVNWSSLGNFFIGVILLAISLWNLTSWEVDDQCNSLRAALVLTWPMLFLYPFYILCGVAILYSLMISLSATSVWLGRNQSLYNFWFYITNFSRYPKEIYTGTFGTPLQGFFTFVIPVLVVVNVPARIVAQPLRPDKNPAELWLAGFAVLATLACLLASRWVFTRALRGYRSASS